MLSSLDQKQVDRLYQLLERAEWEGDVDAAAALRRAIARIVEEIRKIDPDSCVSRNYISGLAKSGAVAVVWAGNKALVNLDDVLDLLRAGAAREEPEADVVGGIRRLDVKRPV